MGFVWVEEDILRKEQPPIDVRLRSQLITRGWYCRGSRVASVELACCKNKELPVFKSNKSGLQISAAHHLWSMFYKLQTRYISPKSHLPRNHSQWNTWMIDLLQSGRLLGESGDKKRLC